MNDIVIIGAGGFGKEIAWLIDRINSREKKFNLLGFIDDNLPLGHKVSKYKVLGTINELTLLKNIDIAIAVGNSEVRSHIVSRLKKLGQYNFPNLVDPSVIYGNALSFGEGNIICAGSILTVDYSFGNFNIVNLDCTIGHDTLLGDFITLYPSVNISGNCFLGNCIEIGTGSQIIQGLKIGDNCIIGAGSVIVKEATRNATIVGVPGKVIKIKEDL